MTGFAYQLTTGLGAGSCVVLCLAARRAPGPWTVVVLRVLGLALLAQSLVWQLAPVVSGTWSVRNYLPLDLCDMADLVAVVACWWQVPLAVELTYFWGVAGTLQGVLTPNLGTTFPHLEFFEYEVEHLGVIIAGLFLVAGLRRYPRPGSVLRIFAVTAGYTALVGAVDAITGADYMFLRAPPATWSLLRVLGPWPWYVLSATGVALVMFAVLDAPFWPARRARSSRTPAAAPIHQPGEASAARPSG